MFGRSKSGGTSEESYEATRLPGLPASAARMLPFLQAEPPCSSCQFTMTPQGRDRTGACSACSAPSAAEPLGFFHECLTCGRRLCAGCSQKEAVGRLTMMARKEVTDVAKQTNARLADDASRAEDAKKRASEKLRAAKTEREVSLEEAHAEQTAAQLSKEALSSELRTEAEALKHGITEAEGELNARDFQLSNSLRELRILQEKIAVAPRPAPEEDDETLEARAEIQHLQNLKITREAETLRHQEAAQAELALEERLQSELAAMQEVAVANRARRLCTLAFARAELVCERRAAEEAVEAELVAALADEAEKERKRHLAEEQQQRREAGASAALVAAGREPPAPIGGDGVFGKFLDKFVGLVENMEPLIAPAPGDAMWGLPMDMQMGMSMEYGIPPEAMTTAASQPQIGDSRIQEPQDEEAEALHLERTAWERKSVACERQLEWMQRDSARRSAEVATLKAEIARLRNEGAHSKSTTAELEQELEAEKARMQDHHRKLRFLLEETVVSCRDRILAALRHGNRGDIVRTKSELESLYDDSSDWAVAGGTSGNAQLRSHQKAEASKTVMADSDYDTFLAGLEALCDDLERHAFEAAEVARDSGNLNAAMSAFNMASDAVEAFDGFPESPDVSPFATKDGALDIGNDIAPPILPQVDDDGAFPEATLLSNGAWPEAVPEASTMAQNR